MKSSFINDSKSGYINRNENKILYLHPDDGINEKQHCDKQADIRQCFEWLNEGP